MEAPFSRRLRAPSFFLTAAICCAPLPAGADDLVRREIGSADYDAARQALVEAIESEGLVPGPVSRFGEMLERSAATLNHGGDLYAEAEIFSFCSIAISAALVRQDPDRIADCPLTIALYRLKGTGPVHLVFRPRPAAPAANALLQRIVERAAAQFPD